MEEILRKLEILIKQTESDSTLLAALIGALAAIVPQVLFWILNSRQDKLKDKLEIKSELHRLQHLLVDHYRELAMHKAHKFYWYAHYQNSESEANEKEMGKFHNFHMASSSRVRETEIKISTTFSEFYKLVTKLQHLTAFDDKLKKLIKEYYDFKPQKPEKIDPEKDDLTKESAKAEARLNEQYGEYISIIDKIVNRCDKK